MKRPSTKQAQEIVNAIRKKNGGFSREDEQGLPEEAKESLRNLQSIAGASIVHVAEDLYDTDTRFVYELIQNAEDNGYDRAVSRGDDPFLHFTLHEDRITVDSNEDGFSEDDVKAICSIHKSTKKQTSGYIGHKGIGFKSVFKIAYKVTIQSGPFCFSFEYRQGDSGLGMMTPFNEALQNLPPDVNTRITLFLIQSRDFEVRETELKEIPDTLLLFLRKLQRLTVEIPLLESHTSHERLQEASAPRITLVKSTNGDSRRRYYLLEKATMSDLPEHSSRRGLNEAELVLAFPVDVESKPLIEPQHVYSFLPMRHEGFKFLIQSDFITQASRQSVHLCPRNYAIRQGISDLFVQAARNFHKDRSFKYTWLQYLPGPDIHDAFWAELRDMIFKALRKSKVLLSQTGTKKYPQDLRRLSARHRDHHGQPLLEDIDPEVYMSGLYKWSKNSGALLELGVTNISYDNILDRLDPYLSGKSPRFLHPDLDEDWHTRLADLLLRALRSKRENSTITKRIKDMSLIPISDGTLASANSNRVYLPHDECGNLIPTDLKDISIIALDLLDNPSRREFIDLMGVKSCEPHSVVESILKRYNKHQGVTLDNSVSHLSYLFRAMGGKNTLDLRIFIMDQTEQSIYRAFVTFGVWVVKDDVYFMTPGKYGTKELSRKLQSKPNRDSNIPCFKMHIIHSAYINAMPLGTISNGRTWEQWLEEVASVRRTPRLKDSRADRISTLCQHIADYHPMTLIGILKTYSSNLESEFTPGVVKTLRRMRVPCRNDITRNLEDIYYPSKEMQRLCIAANVEKTFPSFLDVQSDIITDDTNGWEFLSKLGVGLQPDSLFFVSIFTCLKFENIDKTQIQAAFFEMYKEIYVRFHDTRENFFKNMFDRLDIILIPPQLDENVRFVRLSDCVWNGHRCLETKDSLAIHQEYARNPLVASLFKDIFRLPDAGLETYLDELEARQEHLNVSVDELRVIYGLISQHTKTTDDQCFIVRRLSENELVYLPEKQIWVDPESCVWADATNVGLRYGISDIYADLEEFFCNSLNVQTPTTADYIKQLRKLSSDSPLDIDEIKTAIYEVSALEASKDELEHLCEMQFLPVKFPDGCIKVAEVTDTFFIADRVEYLEAFQDKVPILDFTIGEIRHLYRLLESLGLEDRYMSVSVQEETVVAQPSQEPSSRRTREFRKRARQIYRCILHYNIQGRETDGQSLQRLQESVVYESSGFSKTLLLQMNDVTATVRSDTGLVHIVEVGGVLCVYVPRTRSDRRRCYYLDLPKTLQRHFRLRGSAARLALQVVFLSPGALIDQLLDENGIIRISPEITEHPDSESDTSISGLSDEGNLTAGEIFSDFENSDAPINNQRSRFGTTNPILRTTPTRGGFSSSSPRLFSPSHSARVSPQRGPRLSPQESPYSQLLGDIIRLARLSTLAEVLQIPTNIGTGNGNIAHEEAFGVRSQKRLEHDIRIGAAGELYVFELLLAEELPGFGRTNWRSNIRRHISVHPDYHDLTPWNGVETADIVYRDTSSALTSILVDAGYLNHEQWHSANPTYYMEVKTTTGECDSAFFMSRGQYRRMERLHLERANQADPELYVIFRVHYLGKDNMSVEIYVDPESLRQEGRLIFRPESYSVRPSHS